MLSSQVYNADVVLMISFKICYIIESNSMRGRVIVSWSCIRVVDFQFENNREEIVMSC